MPDESVGFYFNVEKFFGSVSVQRMSFTEKGVYLVMLFQQWREKTKNLPDDPQATAEIIAVTPAQAADVVASWDVVRRKFVTSKHDPARIYNVEIENTRRKQRAYYKGKQESGKSGGLAKARNAKSAQQLDPLQNVAVLESATAHPSSALAHPRDRSSKDRRGEEQIGTEREIPRARSGSPIIGKNPHLEHAICDDTQSRCIPRPLHDSLADSLAPRYGGDREKAKAALVAWYPTVWGTLAADLVIGDAFKFWRPQFNGAFGTAVVPEPTGNKRIAGLMAGGAAFLNRERP